MTERQSVRREAARPDSRARRRIAAYIAELVEEMERLARREDMKRLHERLGAAAQEARRLSLVR